MRKSKAIALAAGTTALSMLAPASRAASFNWTSTAGGTYDWTVPANWGGGGFPTGVSGSGDNANINVNLLGNVNITVPAGNYFVNTLSLGSSVTPHTTDVGNANAGGGTLTFDAGVPGGGPGTYGDIISGGVAGSTNIISAPIILTENSFYSGVLNGDINGSNSSYGNFLVHTTGTLNSQTFMRAVDTGINATLIIDPNSTNDLTINGAISQNAGFFPALANTMSSARTLTINGAIAITNAASATAQAFTITGTNGSRTVINGVIGDGPVASTIHSGLTIGNTNPNKTTVYPAISPTIVLNGTNTYTGQTTFNMATIVVGNDQAFGPAGTTPAASGGQITIAGSANEFGYNLISDNDARVIPNGIKLGQFLTFEGTHSLTLSGYLYQTSNRGFVNLLPAGKTLTMSGSTYTSQQASDGPRTWDLDGTGLTVVSGPIYNNATATAESAGVDGPLLKLGTGTVLVNNTGNTYRGTTTVNGGLLQFASAGSYGVQDSSFVPTGIFLPVTSGVGTVPTYPSGNAGTSSITVNGGGAVGVVTGSTNSAFIAKIVASATNSTGSLALSPADAAVNIDFTNATPGAGNMGAAQTTNMSLGAGNTPVTYTGTITPSGATYRLGGGGTLTLPNAQLTGAGNALVVSNGGKVALGGLNTYGGATTVKGSYVISDANRAATNDFSGAAGGFEPSTLSVSHLGAGSSPSSIGSSSPAAGNLVLSGATLQYTGAGDTTDRLFTMNGVGATLDSSGSGPIVFNNTGAVVQTDAGPIGGATVGRGAGSGAPFNRVNFSSSTDVSQVAVGMTVTDTGGVLAPYAPVTVTGIDSGGQIWLSFQPNSSFVVGSGDTLNFTVQNRTLTLAGTNTGANTLASALTDSGAGKLGIAKTGPGTWVLSGTSTYTGNTTASGGVLEFTAAAAYGNTASMTAGANSAIGADTGSTAAGFLAKFTASSTPSTGALALSASDAAVNLDFTSAPLSGANLVGMSVGALPGGVSYTGTITPAASTYRLGGGGTLTLPNTNALTAGNNVRITNGGVVALTGTNNYTGTTTIDAGSTLNVSTSLPTVSAVTANGNLNFTGNTGSTALPHSAGSISVGTGGHVAVQSSTFPFTPAVLTTSGPITIASGATLDLTNNELVTPGTLAGVVSQITGGKIVTTSTGGALGTLDVGSGNIEVRFTLLGDTNLDGNVDVTDLGNLASSYGAGSSATWVQGDTNYDGAVDVTDLGNLASNYGGHLASGPSAGGSAFVATSLASVASSSGSAVPEPGALSLLTIGAVGLMSRRRRK